MKTMNYSLVSSLCVLITGMLLVVWPDVAVNYLVMTIGVLFLLPGLMGLAAAFRQRQAGRTVVPVAAVGSALFGLWLIIMPAFFIGILMYVLGALLVLAGLSQLSNLAAARAQMPVPGAWFVVPVLVFVAGLVVLFNPFEVATMPFVVLGASAIVYALTDLVRLFRYTKKKDADITDVDFVEEKDEPRS